MTCRGLPLVDGGRPPPGLAQAQPVAAYRPDRRAQHVEPILRAIPPGGEWCVGVGPHAYEPVVVVDRVLVAPRRLVDLPESLAGGSQEELVGRREALHEPRVEVSGHLGITELQLELGPDRARGPIILGDPDADPS